MSPGLSVEQIEEYLKTAKWAYDNNRAVTLTGIELRQLCDSALAHQPAMKQGRSHLEKLVSEYLSAKTTAEREWHLGSMEANQRRLTAAFNALHDYMMKRLAAEATGREEDKP